ncbi:HesA/MoeB/ThiF family protein [bacterium]|nr:HesA/MoeB/ThiF family protein [bacterium]
MGFERYVRQMMLRDWGEEGQNKLKSAKVAVIGAGGLGSPASIYLAVAGVGELRVIDCDVVELSNLNRQILHWDKDIGKLKAVSAEEKLRALNHEIEVIGIGERLTEENAYKFIEGVDVVLDCLDNFPTRFLLNKVCLEMGIPLIHSVIYGLEGRITTIIPGKTPCLSCLYPEPPREIRPFPVVGVVPGVMGCLEALEAIKIIIGFGELLLNKMLRFDGESMQVQVFPIKRRENCPICKNLIKKEV